MKTLRVLVDGLGYEYADMYGMHPDWPVRERLQTVLGYSATAIPSLLTGLTPAEHGGWQLFFRSPRTSPFAWARQINRLPWERVPKVRWKYRAWLERQTAARGDITGYFALYDIPHEHRHEFDVNWRRNLFYDGGMPGPAWLDYWPVGASAARAYVGAYPKTDEVIMAEATKAAADGASHILCYFGRVDGVLHERAHEVGLQDEVLRKTLTTYEHFTQDLVTSMQADGSTVEAAVFSDHGMTPVRRTVDVAHVTQGLRLGKDYMAFHDATFARYWFERDSDRARTRERLAATDGGRLLSATDLVDLPARPDAYGELIWLADPGVVLTPNWMGGAPRGMHGYDPHDRWSDGVIFANFHVQARDVVGLGREFLQQDRLRSVPGA